MESRFLADIRFTTKRILRTHVVATRLRLSRRMIRHLAATGQLRAIRLGHRAWGFLESDVEDFLHLREEWQM
jgi:excisionase family DNA binding protein